MKLKAILYIVLIYVNLFAVELEKAKLYDGTQNINNWLMSEKLDGIRAYWDGKALYTRNGKKIFAPEKFTLNFPPFELDGELWTKRADFENIQSIVLNHTSNENWNQITYNIFEAPHSKGDFIKRLKKIQNWFLTHHNENVHIIPQKICKNENELNEFLNEILELKGEGVMLKNPDQAYVSGRSDFLLKVKKYQDMEARVIGINFNKTNNMKSLTVKTEANVIFRIGTGFTRQQREHPPKIGSIITFKYYGVTKNHIPKFASFLYIRED
ncbi:MAG: DNA ligase [Candidatus Marinarcus sp.]|uniref:DNA ligase n=1 Tax=Candidatus Marinarcus sp. TaxID=3100987 RepID=UPI003B00F274